MPRRKQHCPKRMKYEDGTEREVGDDEEQESDEEDGDEEDQEEIEDDGEGLKHKEPRERKLSEDEEEAKTVSVIVSSTDPSPLAAMEAAFSHKQPAQKRPKLSSPVVEDSSNSVMKLHSLVEAVERGSSSLKAKRASLFSKPSVQAFTQPSKPAPVSVSPSVNMESTLKRIYSTYVPAGTPRAFAESPSPSPDPNEPLDLSTKAKPTRTSSSDKERSSGKSSSGKSSLDALEKKFGGESAILDRVGTRSLSSSNRNAFMSAFGVNLYSSALYSTHSVLPSSPFQRFTAPTSAPSSMPPTLKATESPSARKHRDSLTTSSPSTRHCSSSQPSSKKVVESAEKPATSTFQSQSHSPKYLSSLSPGSSSESQENKKHTSLLCSCGAEFETLYRLTLHLNETGHPPNRTKQAIAQEYPKLVRGQDMWLNQGSEQTRQILRCMQCGESFKTLPELTVHMIQTKHYTNIVGTEPQKKPVKVSSASECSDSESFACKMCLATFEDLEALQYHIGVTGHHKRSFSHHRSHGENSDENLAANSPRPDEAWDQKERRSNASTPSLDEAPRNFSREVMEREDFLAAAAETSTIRCENCSQKIETPYFVEHVRQCVKNKPAGTSSSPAKHSKKSFDYTKYLPSYMNGENKESEEDAKIHSSSNSDLVLPPSTPAPSCALQDMESFIERSFTASKSKKKHFFTQASKLFASQLLAQPLPSSNTRMPPSPPPRPTSRESPNNSCVGPCTGLYQNKYLPPSYLPSEPPVKRESPSPVPSTDEKSCEGIKNGEATSSTPDDGEERSWEAKDKNDNEMPLMSPKKEKEDEEDGSDPPESLPGEKEADKEEVRKEALSLPSTALDSLQGLVYGKSLKKSEHPLDSLQKLIHNTNTKPAETKTPPSSLSGSIPGAVILVNPIVTVMPNGASSPAIQISIPPKSPTNGDMPPSDDEKDADSDSDQTGEYHCAACKRTLASKGAYRYHLSRCHVLKYGIKDAIHTSPYVYLPLDHTAKFNKYYEMAHELASKGK